MLAACPFPWPRGTPIRIQRLAEALTQKGHKVDVVTYHLGQSADNLPFPVHRIAKVAYYRRVSAGPSLTKLLLLDPMLLRLSLKVAKNADYNIIHAHHIEGVMTALAARTFGLKLPIVYDAHTLAGSELQDYALLIGAGLKRMLGNFLDHNLARRADSVIAVTDSIKTAFVANATLAAERIYVIPNGIEDDFIRHADQARNELAQTVIDEEAERKKRDAPVFIFAGNAAAYQGIGVMLKAFTLVLQRFPAARLRILSNDSFTKYQTLLDEMGIADTVSISNVTLDELPAVLVQADVLLNPRSRCAGIPQKLLNYIAAGRPTVSFAGSSKIITNRVDGLVVENDDFRAFADAMLELVENRDLARSLSDAALNQLLVRYHWHSVATQTEVVYRDTLARYAEK
jgi:glycosyltransferase involved in cell wall biosynthesis